MRPNRLVTSLALAAVCGLAAAPLAAQRTPEPKRGWLGFAYSSDMRAFSAAERRGASGNIFVSEVLKGSPADHAGMEPGDTIVSVDHEPATLARIAQVARRIHPGDSVRLEVRRAGKTQELVLKAAERPAYLPQFGELGGNFTLTMPFPAGDSIRRTMRVYLDSARIAMDSLHMPTMRWENHDSVMVFVGPGKHADTIRIGRMDAFPGMRMRMGNDSVLLGLKGQLWQMENGLPTFDVELTGRRAIAGAALQELNSQLAEYFGVREGLLVERVTANTPAARAGLQAGDVVTAADGRAVGDIADLRRALRGREGTVKLDVVRKGKKQELTVKWP